MSPLPGNVRWKNLFGSFLTPSVDLPGYSQCISTHTETGRCTNCINLQFAPLVNEVMKNTNLCQTLAQFTGVHFPELNPNFKTKYFQQSEKKKNKNKNEKKIT